MQSSHLRLLCHCNLFNYVSCPKEKGFLQNQKSCGRNICQYLQSGASAGRLLVSRNPSISWYVSPNVWGCNFIQSGHWQSIYGGLVQVRSILFAWLGEVIHESSLRENLYHELVLCYTVAQYVLWYTVAQWYRWCSQHSLIGSPSSASKLVNPLWTKFFFSSFFGT